MSNHIIIHQPRPTASIRLICFPYAGGTAAAFRAWNELLPTDIEICAVEFPGRLQLNSDPISNMALLVDEILPDIQQILDKPCVFYGHSLGSCVAFECITRIEGSDSVPPKHLIISSRRAPHCPHRTTKLHDLKDDEFIRLMQTQYNAVPEVILQEPELLNRLLPILRADITINETYQAAAGTQIHLPITAMCGQEDLTSTQEELDAWEEATTGSFEYKQFPGGHFFINTEVNILLTYITKICKQYN